MSVPNVLFLGLRGSGKTTLVQHLSQQSAEDYYAPTMGIRFVNAPGQEYCLNDASGSELYRHFVRHRYSACPVVVFVWDTTQEADEQSEYILREKEELQKKNPEAVCLLVINKQGEVSVPEHIQQEFTSPKTFAFKSKEDVEPLEKTLLSYLPKQQPRELLQVIHPELTPQKKLENLILIRDQITEQQASHKVNFLASLNQYIGVIQADAESHHLTKVSVQSIAPVTQLSKKVLNDNVQGSDIQALQNSIRALQLKRNIKIIIGALLGAVVGIVVGALVGCYLGPGAAFTALWGGVQGAAIGAALGGSAVALSTQWSGMWSKAKKEKAVLSGIVSAAEILCKPNHSLAHK